MHPLVLTPTTTTVSTPLACRVEASEVPKKALAYCLTTTSSSPVGATGGISSPMGPSPTSACRAGTLRKNTPPSAPPAL